MTTTTTCAHEACRCTKPYSARTQAAATAPIDPDGDYCSRRCADMAGRDIHADGCECGHPECTPQSSADVPPMQ